jgi:DNA-binding response OmpR family regulator
VFAADPTLPVGTTDHICKPFLYAELLARIRAVLRRAEGRRRRGVLRVGELTVDPLTRTVRLGGRRLDLSAKEFALLHALAEEPSRVYGKHELLRDVWGVLSAGIRIPKPWTLPAAAGGPAPQAT